MKFAARKKAGFYKSQPRKKRRKFRMLISVILATFLLIVLFRANQIIGHSIFLSNDHFGIVLNTNPIAFFHINRESGQKNIVLVSSDTYVEATRGFGLYRMGSIWALGEIEGEGGKLLSETMQELLAVPVHAWLGRSDATTLSSDDGYVSDLKAQFSLQKLLVPSFSEEFATNLTIIDKFLLVVELFNVRANQIDVLDLSATDAVSEFELADESRAISVDVEILDTVTGSIFENQKIREEGLSVEVRNATDRPFLAQKASRTLSNLGVKVVRVGNSNVNEPRCVVYGSEDLKKTETAKTIRALFNCSFITDEQGRSIEDLEVVIGESYSEKLFASP